MAAQGGEPGVLTPAFDRLRPYVDPAVPPIREGSSELPQRWGEMLPWAGAPAALLALAVIVTRIYDRRPRTL
jgi:hypothetical protein